MRTLRASSWTPCGNYTSHPDKCLYPCLQLLAEQSEVQAEIDRLDCWNLDHTIAIAKQALRVPPDNAVVASLSGGV